VIYFVQERWRLQIKIGWCSHETNEMHFDHNFGRMRRVRQNLPQPSRVLGTMPGGQKQERELHRMFAKLRRRGEWFANSTALRTFIRRNCKDGASSWES
jgi:hypothetical protein